MQKNEIKKLLYKQKPVAVFNYIQSGEAFYHCEVETGSQSKSVVNFQIPIDDMGEAVFGPIMEGALLIRWIKDILQ